MPQQGKPRRLDLTGQTFSDWIVLEKGDIGRNGAIFWKCRCKCGETKEVTASSLRNETSKSCGCDRVIHGQSFTPTGRAWYGMRQRCYNPNDKNYDNYGGRGITVCKKWLESIENFITDMGHPPEKGFSIDRIDVNGNYEPENCRWASRITQQRNRRNNLRVEHEGKSVTVVELAERYGLTVRTLRYRLSNHWTLKEALETPQQK